MDKELKKQLKETSGLKDSIKIFFMENFRKLAMGLQAQIDSLDRRLAAESLWDRNGTTLTTQNANDSIYLGVGYIESYNIQDKEEVTTVAAGTSNTVLLKESDRIGMRVLANDNTGSFTSATIKLQLSLNDSDWDDYMTFTLDTAADDHVDAVAIDDFFTWEINNTTINRSLYVRYNVSAISVTGDADIDIKLYKE